MAQWLLGRRVCVCEMAPLGRRGVCERFLWGGGVCVRGSSGEEGCV